MKERLIVVMIDIKSLVMHTVSKFGSVAKGYDNLKFRTTNVGLLAYRHNFKQLATVHKKCGLLLSDN